MPHVKLKCKHCGCTIDPNGEENEHLWGPPVDPKNSIGALTCPECNTKEDFVDWTPITTGDPTPPQAA